MLVALDARVKAATIVGLTCDFRQIMFPAASHCACNHFPGVMRRTDHPEISMLGLPAAVQFLTMNDWTRTFEAANFPTLQRLYDAHGAAERVFCKYFNTEHSYDRTKREYTYWWMERWLRGRTAAAPESEPDTPTLPVDTLLKLSTPVPGDKGFADISRHYRVTRGYQAAPITSLAEWQAYRSRMLDRLRELLGEAVTLPRKATPIAAPPQTQDALMVERIGYPSEGPIVVPTVVLRPAAVASGPAAKRPVVVMLGAAGGEKLLAETGPGSPRAVAESGQLVVLPDVRTYGALLSTGGKNDAGQRQAWERNGIVWGRPVPGMAATDLRAVLDGVVQRADADGARITVVVRAAGDLAAAALFAMAVDERIAVGDLDFAGACFAKRNLPLVSCVLQHGDVLQWAALSANRQLTLHRVPPEAGDTAWLTQVFTAAGNPTGLHLEAN
jgi:hypothetical protein